MRPSFLASRPGYLICPLCEAGRLCPEGQGSTTCRSCRTHLHGDMLETLRSVSALPDAAGSHACECGHPEMGLLPDGTYHCHACGSEVLPVDVPSAPSEPDEDALAYWSGWADGRFGEWGGFVENPNLARWEEPSDRLAYYKGHRAGRESRRTTSSPDRTPTIRGLR